MSITAPDDRITSYAPVVATTTFAADFPVFDNDDIKVFVDGVERTDFAVSATYVQGISNDARAVFNPGITGKVDVVGARDPRRTSRFINGAPLQIWQQNLALDTVVAEVQEAKRDIERSHRAPYGEAGGIFSASEIGNAQGYAEAAREEADRSEEARDAAAQSVVDANQILAEHEVKSFPTIADAAAAIFFAVPTFIRTEGYLSAGDGGGALYRLASSEPTHAGRFQASDGSWWELADGQLFNIRMFGALPTVANNRQALQNALDFAKIVSRQMHIPAGLYPYAATSANILTSSGSILLTGDGRKASVLQADISGATDDGLRINCLPGEYGNFSGHIYRDFTVVPQTAGAGRNGIRFVLQAGVFLANFLVDGVEGGDFGKQGIHFDNSINNLDGFFVGRVRNCVSMNGFGGIKVGDSLKFEDCQGPAGTLCTTPSWDVSGVPGARQYLFIGHSNTSRSGAAKFTAVDQLRFMFNQNEHGWWTGNGQYNGDTDALISVKDCLQPWIVGNTGNPFHNFSVPTSSAQPYHLNIGSPVMTSLSGGVDPAIQIGDRITGSGIPAGATVVSKTATTITASANATATTDNVFDFARVVNPNGAAYTLLLDGTTNMPIVEYNDFAAGRVAHIAIAGTVKNAYIGLNHYYGNISPTIADSGIGTMGVWRALEAFANGWNPSAKTPKARKTKDRIVHLQGAINPGTMGVTALTLPEGFRPETSLELVAIGSIAGAVALVRIVIGSNGALSVYAVGGATGHTLVNLDGINFFAPLVA